MQYTSTIAAIAALAVAAQSLEFSVNPLSIDVRLLPPRLQINFTVSAPGSVVYQGGPDPAQCNLTLYVRLQVLPFPDATRLTSYSPGRGIGQCWNACEGGSGQYYARVTPSSFVSESNFSLDIWQAYVYELGNHNNASIPIRGNDTCADYTCTKLPQDIVCQTGDASEGFNATYTAYYGGADPPQEELCVE